MNKHKYDRPILRILDRTYVNRKLKEEGEKHHFKVLTSHSFRRSAATLGHESILSTEKYTRVIKEDLKRVVKDHHPRELII